MEMEAIFKVLLKEILDFYNSSAFFVIKIFLGIYALILFINIILLVIQRGLSGNLRQAILGADMPEELTTKKDRLRKRWDNVRKRLDGEKEAEYKIAIIEADGIMDDLLGRMGYAGENLGEKLAAVPAGQLENISDMLDAHEIRNKIVLDESFGINQEEAKKTLEKFEKFLRYFEVLD